MKRLIYFLPALLLFSACKPEIDAEEWSMGSVDASRYVAIGGGSTAGYMDDALYTEGQDNSFAAIIAAQMNLVSACEFNAPSSYSTIGSNLAGLARLQMGYKTDCKGVSSLSPVRASASGDVNVLGNSVASYGPFRNLGVPGLGIHNVLDPNYGNAANGSHNPFYARFAASPGNSTLLSEAISQNPSFFTVQLGEDEIMNYALTGATTNHPAPINGPSGEGFNGSLIEILQGLTGNGARGVLGTVPDVTSLPYFTTIPWDGLVIGEEDATTLNQVFNPINIYFQVGANGFAIEDLSQPFGVRKMVEGELILLSIPLDSVKCYGMGTIVPIPNRYVLTLDEIASIRNLTQGYNQVIESLASVYGLAVADVEGLYAQLETGFVYNGVTLSNTFVSGGAYSLDGRHLNPRGQAMLANTYIKAINSTYGARIPLADPTNYRGIKFP
jgi:hypothetical protein